MITTDDLNERPLEVRSAHICVEPEIFSILGASNVGLGACGIKEGIHRYTYSDAIYIIHEIDKLLPSAPKYLQKRIRATRMSFVFAFGPEMEEQLSCSTGRVRAGEPRIL